jgi:HD superfamily phosphohydrolase YqeK
MIPFTFEKLEVYQKAIAFADVVYDATKTFPNEERFGLSENHQMILSKAHELARLLHGLIRSRE